MCVLTSGNTAGTVTVNVTVAADANYNALAATPITITIKCPYSNEWVDGKWYNKDGSQTRANPTPSTARSTPLTRRATRSKQ